MIDATQAIAIAEKCSALAPATWNEKRISVSLAVIEGVDFWVIETEEPFVPGEPDWARPWHPYEFTFYIGVETGLFHGYKSGRIVEWFRSPIDPNRARVGGSTKRPY